MVRHVRVRLGLAGTTQEITMKFKTTNRGFSFAKFTDRSDVVCSIQKSSLATEDAIWLGCNDADPRILAPEGGWQKVSIPGMLCNTRMHLSQDQVKALLPVLQHFAETGDLP